MDLCEGIIHSLARKCAPAATRGGQGRRLLSSRFRRGDGRLFRFFAFNEALRCGQPQDNKQNRADNGRRQEEGEAMNF